MSEAERPERTIVPGEFEGFLAGCPFCTARRKRVLDVGARFRFLSGYFAGKTGTVVQEPDGYSSRPHEMLAQMDDEPPHVQSGLNTDTYLVQILPAPKPPTWAPPITMADAAPVDAAIVEFCQKSYLRRRWSLDWPAFYELIRVVWWNRLPLEPNELWAMMEAHGAPKNWESRLTKFFSMGRELLVHVGQRRPIKKKRVAPLSFPREKA